jgi:hypothetical protein
LFVLGIGEGVCGDEGANGAAIGVIGKADRQDAVQEKSENEEKGEKEKADEEDERSRFNKDSLDWKKRKYEDQRQDVTHRSQLERDRFNLEKDKFEKAHKEKEDRMNMVKEWIKEGKSTNEIEHFLQLIYGTQTSKFLSSCSEVPHSMSPSLTCSLFDFQLESLI